MLGKTTTLRLDADRSARLALVARVELTSQAAVVRDALDASFATRSADPTFRTPAGTHATRRRRAARRRQRRAVAPRVPDHARGRHRRETSSAGTATDRGGRTIGRCPIRVRCRSVPRFGRVMLRPPCALRGSWRRSISATRSTWSCCSARSATRASGRGPRAGSHEWRRSADFSRPPSRRSAGCCARCRDRTRRERSRRRCAPTQRRLGHGADLPPDGRVGCGALSAATANA